MGLQGRDTASIALEERTARLRETQGDNVPIEKIADIGGSIVTGVPSESGLATVAEELESLLKIVSSARSELVELQPKSMANRDIPDANAELDAVVQATEDAATVIMDSADEISEIAATSKTKISGDRLQEISTTLMEASSFQDLTGQRLTKVARTLSHLEERLENLAAAIGDDYVRPESDEIEKDTDGVAVNDTDLLHGPQNEGEGNSQAEIDALLASFD